MNTPEPVTSSAPVDQTIDSTQTQVQADPVQATPAAAPASSASDLGQPAAQTQAQAQQDLRSRLSSSIGVDLTRYQDDDQALNALGGLMRQAVQWRQAAEQYQQIVPYWSQFQQYLQQQSQPKQPDQQQQKWWTTPEYDPSWQQAIEVDPATGQPRVKPGYSPDILNKITTYQNWQRDTLSKLLTDPISTLKQGIVELVQPMIKEAVSGNLGQYQQQVQASQIVNQNLGWIYQTDATGQAIRNPVTGAPEFSPAGKLYAQYVAMLDQQGIKDPQTQHQMAKSMTMGRLAEISMQGQARPQQQPQQAAPVAGVAGAANRIAQMQSNGTANTTRPQVNSQSSLRQMLQQAFDANGVTDEAMRRDSGI